MKKFILPLLSIWIIACSKDSDVEPLEGGDEETTNTAPMLSSQQFQVAEHAPSGTSLGSVVFSDPDTDFFTFTVTSDADILIDENTGELSIGENLILDFETLASIPFTVSIFDGEAITEADMTVAIEDIDEYDALNTEQKEIVDQFKFLTLFQAQTSPTQQIMRKWDTPMKLFLDGTISASFKTTVENVIAEYNTIMASGDFNISLVESEAESNAKLFFGEKAEVEAVFPIMYDEIKDLTVSGYARGSFQGNFYFSSQIWISNPTDALFKHEMGHALGLGHSEFCDSPNPSVMCSSITPGSDFLDIEKEAIHYFYHENMPSGLNASEIEFNAANLILLGE